MTRRCVRALLLLALGLALVQAQTPSQLVWPQAPQPPRIAYVGRISSATDVGGERSFLRKVWDWIVGADRGPTFLVKPMGVAVDRRGTLYVADPGARCVHVFDRARNSYEAMTDAETGALRTPIGVAVAPDGRIYVTDSERREVIVYDADLDVVRAVSGRFVRPTGIAILGNRLYVVDTGRNAILFFSLEGDYQGEFGCRGGQGGEFNYPVYLASSRYLYVTDAMNFRVQILDDSGVAKRVFGKLGNVQGTFANPKGIAVDSEGHIYVADALFDAVQIFDGEGQLLLVVGSSGQSAGQFSMPEGICVDAQDRVYVADALNRRVQIFQYLKGY